MAQAGLVLINLQDQGVFVFQYFPQNVRTSDRANWQAQETTIGVKPLFYANREPRRTEFQELYFDNTETGESLTETLKELRKLMDETERGTPTALQAAWGDRHERCVLEELSIEECFFNTAGEPTRARISLSLLQIQSDSGEAVSVTVND